MLLRRITQHVKDQNWTAIGLDFVIVVVGVFIGLQVASWNDGRLRDSDAQEARQNLVADLKNDLDVFEVRRRFYEETLAAAERLEGNIDGPPIDDGEQQWAFIWDAYSTGNTWPFRPSGLIYRNLQNAGELDLVLSDDILRQLRDYYEDAGVEIGITFQFDSAYRENSRRLIEWELNKHINSVCKIISADPSQLIEREVTYLPICPSPGETVAIVDTVQRLQQSDDLHNDLRSRLNELILTLSMLEYLSDEASTLIQEIEEDDSFR